MTVLTPSELVVALLDWGVSVKAYEPDGKPWYSHTTPGGWSPVGVMHHHTTGPAGLLTSAASQEPTLRVLRYGRGMGAVDVGTARVGLDDDRGLALGVEARGDAVPGPLCHLAPAMVPGTAAARVWLIGFGNCNHAGLGSSRTLAAVKVGTYDGAKPGPDDTDGNPWYWGLEYLHPGTTPVWPDALLEAGHRTACAICEASGWSVPSWPGSNVEHREWTTRKIDRSWPGDIHAAIRKLSQEGKMAITKDDAAMVADATLTADVIPINDWETKKPANPQNPTWQLKSVAEWLYRAVSEILARGRSTHAQTAAHGAQLADLALAVKAAQTSLARIESALASPGGLTAEQVEAAVEDGATKAVARVILQIAGVVEESAALHVERYP